MGSVSFSVLGPLMGGFGSQAFMGCVHEADGQTRPVVMVFLNSFGKLTRTADARRVRKWMEAQRPSSVASTGAVASK